MPLTLTAPDTGPVPLLEVAGLRTYFDTPAGVVKAVDGVDLRVDQGRTVCVVGESGSGKSVTARSILQLVDKPGRLESGTIAWSAGTGVVDLAPLDPRGSRMRAVRGREISMIFQEPSASLSPLRTVGAHLIETLRLLHGIGKAEAFERGVELLRRVRIPRPADRMSAYPFQLSGGMCQRVMIALAIAGRPRLLIADEPTTALDVTTQAQILDLLLELQEQDKMAMLFITHDLGVVAEIADDVVVMYRGTVVERGPVDDIFHAPAHPYTRALLASMPVAGASRRRRAAELRGSELRIQERIDQESASKLSPEGIGDDRPSSSEPAHNRAGAAPERGPAAPSDVLSASTVVKLFDVQGRGFFARNREAVKALDGVELGVRAGEILGLVGESGSGKTTLARCFAGAETPTSGRLSYVDERGRSHDLTSKRGHALLTQIRMVFQDPFTSLNPRHTVEQIVADPLVAMRLARGSELTDRVEHMIRRVGLSPAHLRRHPHAFSGGERQRISIARALITGPRVVIADEAVSALDASVRAQVLDLIQDLAEELSLTVLFVSHDLSVVENMCDRVAVMYLGRIVELADTDSLYRAPQHPYTEALLAAVPIADPRLRRRRKPIAAASEPA